MFDFSSLSTIYAKYSNSTTRPFNNSNQAYKYGETGKDRGNLLNEPAFKHRV